MAESTDTKTTVGTIGKSLMQQSKYFTGYSRYNPETSTYERWPDSVDRVIDMHYQKYAEVMTPKLERAIERARQGYENQLFLGSQRNLQFAGPQIFQHETRSYNCATTYCDRTRFFAETMYVLLCGAGVGFSMQKHHVYKLPKIQRRYAKKSKVFTVPDSIEGWADAVDVLLSSFFENGGNHPEYKGCNVHFDFSQIRPKGAYISGGFKAPGPDGLRQSLILVEDLINNVLQERDQGEGTQLKPIECYDITMYVADAVLSGGVRRSATICLFSPDDEEMINAKTGNWFIDNPQRARSNNSAMLVRNETSWERFYDIIQRVQDWGEPGFVWSESTEHVFNPCVEANMYPVASNGETGFQYCLTGDTMVLTDTGYRDIYSLLNEVEFNVIAPYPTDQHTASDVQQRTIKRAQVFQTGMQPVYNIELHRGQSITATANHKFLTQDGYIAVEDLDIDYHKLFAPAFDIDVPQYDEYQANEYDFLGWLIGDGWFTNNPNQIKYVYESLGIIFGSEEDQTAEEHIVPVFHQLLQEAIESGHNRKATVSKTRYVDNAGVATYVTHSARARYIAKKFGLTAGTAKDKQLPEQYWSLSLENKARVLGALFCADGSVSNTTKGTKHVRLAMSNPYFARQVQLALSEFGIVSKYTISERKHSSRCDTEVAVTITSRENIERFSRTIGFRLHPRKQRQLTELLASYVQQYNRSYNWMSISQIEPVGVQDVYDISVEEAHNFIANGIITHNCNLSEINGAKCTDRETLMEAVYGATVLGTLQAGYTNFTYLTDATRRITEREALIGVGITGWMNNPDVLFDQDNMRDAANYVRQVNKEIADLIGINYAARCTVVKPSGNASTLLGCASGIHGEHSKRYLRNIQLNENDEVLRVFENTNPVLTEPSVWSAYGTDKMVSLPVEVPDGSWFKEDLQGVRQLEYVKHAQQNWVEYGTNVELCVDPTLRHNVSNTIDVDDWEEVARYIYDNRQWFAGISLMPATGDRAFPQAPFQKVKTGEEIFNEWGEASMFASGLIVDALSAFGDLWKACNAVLFGDDTIDEEAHEDLLKRDWIRRAYKFAHNYFNDNLDDMTVCLKDCHLLHKWRQIERRIEPVEFAEEMGEQEYTEVDEMAGAGCAGGSCDISHTL